MADITELYHRVKEYAAAALFTAAAALQLFYNGCSSNAPIPKEPDLPKNAAARTIEDMLDVPKYVRDHISNLEKEQGPYRPILVRLTRDLPYFFETDRQGKQINSFARLIGRETLPTGYNPFEFSIAFYSTDSDYIALWAKKLDKDGNLIITQSEQD